MIQRIFLAVIAASPLSLTTIAEAQSPAAGEESPQTETNTADTTQEPAPMAHAGHTAMLMGHHAMAHPFLAHMGIPDGPGEANIRLTGIGRIGHEESGVDGGIHIEAGLTPRLGIHVRADTITAVGIGGGHHDDTMEEGHEEEANHAHVPPTEIMVMYALYATDDQTSGISVFGQLAWPRVRSSDDTQEVTTAGGIGARYMAGNRFLVDGNIHVEPFGGVHGEYEIGLMVRPTGQFFLILEDRGSVSSSSFSSYLLPAIKYRFEHVALGLGAQFPIVGGDYDVQGMAQLDIGFM
jgi:hypothetical protein